MECRICLAPDPGNNYKDNCCRACAAFFRRTLQMKLRYRCNLSQDCKVTRENRLSCRYCRMKRCIEAGMSSSEDSEDSLDFYLDHSSINLPEIYCFPTLSGVSLDDIVTPENVFTNHEEFCKQHAMKMRTVMLKKPAQVNLPFQLSLYQRGTAAHIKFRKRWPGICKQRLFFNNTIDVALMYYLNLKLVVYVTEFYMEFQQFSQLPLDQKLLVQSQCILRFLYFDGARITSDLLGNDIHDTRVVLYNGQVVDYLNASADISKVSDCENDLAMHKLCRETTGRTLNFITQFKRVNPDHFEFIYLLLSGLWNVKGIPGISPETLKTAEEEHERLLGELMHYYKFEKKLVNYAARIYKMENLLTHLNKVNSVMKEDSRMAKIFDTFKFNVYLNDTIPVLD